MRLFSRAKDLLATLLNKGAGYIIAGSFLTKFVAFFSSIFLVRVLSKTDYGVLSYYENIMGYILIIQGLGLEHSVSRYVAVEPEKKEKAACFRYAVKRGSKNNVVILLCSAIIAIFYPHPTAFAKYWPLLIIMTAGIPFSYLQQTSLNAMRSSFETKKYATIAFLASLLLISARLFGAYLSGLQGAVISKLIVEFILGVVCLYTVSKMLHWDVAVNEAGNEKKREYSNYGIQMMITNGLWAVFMLNGTFLLGQLLADEKILATYRVAYSIPGNLSLVTSAIGVFVGPYFAKHERMGDYKWVWHNYFRVVLTSSVILGALAIGCFVFAKPILKLLYGDNYYSAIPIMRILLGASFFNNAIRYITAHILSFMGKPKYNIISAGIGIALQISLDLILIPKYGMKGAAITEVLLYLLMAVFLVTVFVTKFGKIKR